MFISETEVKTTMAARYLAQLCKHFAHKLAVTHDATSGRIEFSSGVCLLAVQGDVMTLRAEAANPAALQQVQSVIDRHLMRFAFRDQPEVVWQCSDPQHAANAA